MPPQKDIFAERCHGALRLRFHGHVLGCPRAISSLFFIDNKVLRVTEFRARRLRAGMNIKRSRYRFSEIRSLGLLTWIDAESSAASWAIVLKLVDGRQNYLSFAATDYSRYDAALVRICEETGIVRFDPI
jgi:hypothetical protein